MEFYEIEQPHRMPAQMNELPEKLVLHATRTRAIVTVALALLFLLLLITLNLLASINAGDSHRAPNTSELVAMIAFFGGGIAVCIPAFTHPAKLELHRSHFVRVGLFGTIIRNWNDVSKFRVFRDRAFVKQISFYPIEVDNMQGLARKIAWLRGKVQLETYGMEASDMADLLNSFRERAISGGK